MSDTKQETKDPDEPARINRVLNAAGRSARIADHLPDKYRAKLAGLCGAGGQLAPAVRDKVIAILGECGREQKASIEGAEDKE